MSDDSMIMIFLLLAITCIITGASMLLGIGGAFLAVGILGLLAASLIGYLA